ncbi:MAG: DUF1559 domain-containing protein [Fuerstiella sp.]
MQSRRSTAASRTKRRGFTLIELLVVISIIATLMSLILPAIQNAREAGRRTQCLNNIRNITVATLNFASSNRSRLPALGYFPLNPASGTPPRINGRSWVVELLPYMDQQGTYDRWDKDLPFDSTIVNVNGAINRDLASDLYVEALACPNDESAFVVPGGLSYVANAGFGDYDATADSITNDSGNELHSFRVEPFDWNGNSTPADATDIEVTKATGVFWSEFATIPGSPGIPGTRNDSATIGKIYDGSGNTIMFGENINAGGTNWADPRTRACGFMFPLEPSLVNATTLNNPTGAISQNATPANRPAYPNQAKTGPEGQRPYLNSNHPGIVVISMCDGSARTISENIDENVYVRLITPNGTRLRNGIGVEDPLSADSF